MVIFIWMYPPVRYNLLFSRLSACLLPLYYRTRFFGNQLYSNGQDEFHPVSSPNTASRVPSVAKLQPGFASGVTVSPWRCGKGRPLNTACSELRPTHVQLGRRLAIDSADVMAPDGVTIPSEAQPAMQGH